MKIIIDTRWIRGSKIDGIGSYMKELLNGLVKADQKNQYILLYNDNEVKKNLEKSLDISNKNNFSFHRIDYGVLTFRHFLKLPYDLNKIGYDIFFSLNYLMSPFFKKNKYIVIVYDLIPFLFKFGRASFRWRIFYKSKFLIKTILKKARKIIAISKNTAYDIERVFKIPTDSIEVIYNGIDKNFVPASHEAILKTISMYEIDKQLYLFYIGRFDPYKNVLAIIEAYSNLPTEVKNKFALVIGGNKKNIYFNELEDKVKEYNLQNRVKFIGFVSEVDLPSLYSGASMFLFPSLYEGFGMPVLEAMACGTPVITSNVSSMPEIANGAAILVDPMATEKIRDAILRLVNDDDLKNKLIQKGFEQVKKFSNDNYTKKLLIFFDSFRRNK